jgi:hypothetical protein
VAVVVEVDPGRPQRRLVVVEVGIGVRPPEANHRLDADQVGKVEGRDVPGGDGVERGEARHVVVLGQGEGAIFESVRLPLRAVPDHDLGEDLGPGLTVLAQRRRDLEGVPPIAFLVVRAALATTRPCAGQAPSAGGVEREARADLLAVVPFRLVGSGPVPEAGDQGRRPEAAAPLRANVAVGVAQVLDQVVGRGQLGSAGEPVPLDHQELTTRYELLRVEGLLVLPGADPQARVEVEPHEAVGQPGAAAPEVALDVGPDPAGREHANHDPRPAHEPRRAGLVLDTGRVELGLDDGPDVQAVDPLDVHLLRAEGNGEREAEQRRPGEPEGRVVSNSVVVGHASLPLRL